jgi:hypothetical protein
VIVNPFLPRLVRVRVRTLRRYYLLNRYACIPYEPGRGGGESSQLLQGDIPDTEVASAAFHRMVEGPFGNGDLEIRLFRQLKSFLVLLVPTEIQDLGTLWILAGLLR